MPVFLVSVVRPPFNFFISGETARYLCRNLKSYLYVSILSTVSKYR